MTFDGVLARQEEEMMLLTTNMVDLRQWYERVFNDLHRTDGWCQPIFPRLRQHDPLRSGLSKHIADLLCTLCAALRKPRIELARMQMDNNGNFTRLRHTDQLRLSTPRPIRGHVYVHHVGAKAWVPASSAEFSTSMAVRSPFGQETTRCMRRKQVGLPTFGGCSASVCMTVAMPPGVLQGPTCSTLRMVAPPPSPSRNGRQTQSQPPLS